MNHVQTLRKKELICGLVFLPIYIFVMPILIGYASFDIFNFLKINPSDAHVTLLYYFIAFVFVLIFMGSFLKESFFSFTKGFARSLYATLLGYVAYVALLYTVALLVSLLFTQQEPNPNTAAVQKQLMQNSKAMLMSSMVLAPIVEETLFRGVIFAPLLKVNRVAAYAVSFLVFAVYHIWQYVFTGISPQFLIYILQYLPGSLVLSWTYERSGTIWSPILLHMLINAAAIYSF